MINSVVKEIETMEQHTDHRYPGSRPFYDTDLDRRLFFGRNHEKQSLLHMVLAERLVVLFAKSGIGKTSLINAGLIQQLRKRDYVSIKIRLNDPKEDPVKTLLARIKEEPSATVEDKSGEANSLWQFFKTVEFWSTEDTLMTPVLILDQFEELFTLHSAEHRRHFIAQLADLVRERPPKELTQHTTAEQKPLYSESPPDLKIIIAIREDFLAQLEELADEIPAILQNRFRLLPLDRNQARLAIEEPAQLEDEHLDTARFEYAPETVETMLDFLCKRKDKAENIVSDEVEPFQLQLLCQYIENKVRRLQDKESSGVIIHKEDLGGQEEMRQVLKHFYNHQIHRLKPGWKKKNVRNLCEKGLISETERRLSLEEGEIERKYRVPKIILGELVNNRLLRSEPRVGSVYYELSHDTLVNSIRKAQIERKKRNAKVLTSSILIGLVVLIGAFFYFGGQKLYVDISIEYKYREAKKLKDKGRFDEAIAKYEEILKRNTAHSGAYEELGNIYLEKGNLADAKGILDEALNEKVQNATIYYLLGKVYDKQGLFDDAIFNYEESIKLAENFPRVHTDLARLYGKKNEIDNAIHHYETALEKGDNNAYTYKELAKLYVKKRDIDAAIAYYQEAIKVEDKSGAKNVYTYKDLADLYERRRDFESAIKNWMEIKKVGEKSANTYRKLVILYVKNGDSDKAVKFYKEALEEDPAYLFLFVALTIELARKKADAYANDIYEIAFKEYLNSQDINKKNATMYKNLAFHYFKNDNNKKAIEGYERILKLRPEYADIHVSLANWLIREESNKEDIAEVYEIATNAYKKLVDDGDRQASTLKNLAMLYIKQEKFDKAVQVYEQHVSATPSNAYLYANLVISLKKKKAHKQVDDIYKIATKAYENLVQTDDKESRTNYRSLAKIYVNQNKFDKAVRVYEQAISANPGNANLYRELVYDLRKKRADDQIRRVYSIASGVELRNASYYIKLGDDLYSEKKYENALKNYQGATRVEPGNAEANSRVGISQLTLMKYDRAIDSFNKAIEIDKQFELGYIGLTTALIKKGKYWDAIKILEKALGRKDTISSKRIRANAYNNLGYATNKQGLNYNKAIEHLGKSKELDTSAYNFLVFSNLGHSNIEIGNFKAAQKNIQDARKLLGSYAAAKNFLYSAGVYKNEGRLNIKNGNIQKALTILKSAKQNYPRYIDTYYNLALAYLKTNQADKVDQLFLDAIKLDPENIDFKRHYLEVFFGSERYEQAYAVAQEILKEEKVLSKEMHLLMRVASIAALLFQGKRTEANGELETFIADYKALNKNKKPFQIGVKWKYVVTENKANPKAVLSENDKNLILALIDILESPMPEANKKFANLEAEFS